jgi:quercetin dioxygenase-like cupin family protein
MMPFVDPADALNAPVTHVSAEPVRPGEAWSRLALIATDKMRLVAIGMPAHDRTIPHTHPRAGEYFYILSGSGGFSIGDNPRLAAAPGDLVFAPAGVEHAIFAGPDGFRFLAGMAPNDNLPDEETRSPENNGPE